MTKVSRAIRNARGGGEGEYDMLTPLEYAGTRRRDVTRYTQEFRTIEFHGEDHVIRSPQQ